VAWCKKMDHLFAAEKGKLPQSLPYNEGFT